VSESRRRRVHWPKITRDTMIFLAGLGGFLYQLLPSVPERPTLIYACVALLGVVPVLQAQDRRNEKRNGNGHDTEGGP
jgi:hypothetical protein